MTHKMPRRGEVWKHKGSSGYTYKILEVNKSQHEVMLDRVESPYDSGPVSYPLEAFTSFWSIYKLPEPLCPVCDKRPKEDNDYLCRPCRWGH